MTAAGGAAAGGAALVTLHAWRVPPTGIPGALWRMAVDRRRLRRTPGVAFAKLLGTGRGSSFGPATGDLTRWVAMVGWDDAAAAAGFDRTPVGRDWARLATAACRLTLRPISSRGTWAGREPFRAAGRDLSRAARDGAGRDGAGRDGAGRDGAEPGAPILVLTRARLRASRAATFWRAIDPVADALAGAPGLLTALGVGEAPLGFQGTVSVWRSAADVAEFAYRQPQHAAVVTRTPVERWYAEELFARFTVLDVSGDPGVIGWTAGT
ncbi:MAG TPA: monooxygenase [Micromonosporaceae bacterium]|nr:monooxygenase [Micromonosporaceae bacterium]